MKTLCLLCICFFSSCTLSGQYADYRMDLWKSEVKDKQFRLIGNDGMNLVFIKKGMNEDSKILYVLDEGTTKFTPTNKKIKSNNGKIVDAFTLGKLIVMTGYYSLPEKYKKLPIDSYYGENNEFHNLWIQKDNKTYLLDTFSGLYADMFFHFFISQDERYLFCTKFDLDGEASGVFIYDLNQIEQTGKALKKEIKNDMCKNIFRCGDSFIFNKGLPFGYGNDDISYDVFIAPIKNINDTVLVAANINILASSSDGRYIFGIKTLHGKDVNVILDVKTKRLQYMFANQNYTSYNCYYSSKKNEFVCDNQDKLIYFDIPDVFPFDALEGRFKSTTKEDDLKFWEGIKKLQKK